MITIRHACIIVAAAVCFSLTAGSIPAQPQGAVMDVEEAVGTLGTIDWSTGVITASGTGAPPTEPTSAAQARTIAERSAQKAAYRNLLEAVQKVQVDSSTTVRKIMVASTRIRSEVSGIIRSAMVMDKKYLSDGSVEVTVGMRLTGALADSVLPKKHPEQPSDFGVPPQTAPRAGYTGLIVDARGLGVQPAMACRILSETGKEVYGFAWISRDRVVREGMVGYRKDPLMARKDPRVTGNPLLVKAIKTSGEAPVDVIISDDDVVLLRGDGQRMNFLDTARVIMLVD